MESGATPRYTRILFTGPPGIGKTTLCKKIVSLLLECKMRVDGFYTEEVRSRENKRMGFDVVGVGEPERRGVLARIDSALDGRKPSNIRVGPYHVFISEFESTALPTLNANPDVLVIDEIGKMELFSKSFHQIVENLFFGKNTNHQKIIIATIPARDKIPPRYSTFFAKFSAHPSCQVIEVNRENRGELVEKTISNIKKILNHT